ncbi:MAG: hypothetical protein QOH91_4081 [Mycobacterium sp.]|jgi:hypothetical protein|nr:hypothetical protein [Mycobacterium sp.]
MSAACQETEFLERLGGVATKICMVNQQVLPITVGNGKPVAV